MKKFIRFFTVFILLCITIVFRNTFAQENENRIFKFSNNGYTFYESEYFRVYFSYFLNIGYNVEWDSIESAKKYYEKTLNEFGILFEKNILKTKQFFANRNYEKEIINNEPILVSDSSKLINESFYESLNNYDGYILKIFTFEPIPFQDKYSVKYYVRGTQNKNEDGWGVTTIWEVDVKSKEQLSDENYFNFINSIYEVMVSNPYYEF